MLFSNHVKLEVFDQMGRRVAVVVDGTMEKGAHVVRWDASDQATGLYLYRLTAEDFVETRRMLLVK